MGIKAFEDTGLKGMHKSSDEGFVAIGQKDRWMQEWVAGLGEGAQTDQLVRRDGSEQR